MFETIYSNNFHRLFIQSTPALRYSNYRLASSHKSNVKKIYIKIVTLFVKWKRFLEIKHFFIARLLIGGKRNGG